MLPILRITKVEGPILVVSPHPDDDVLGSGGLIQSALSHHKTVYVLYVTTGDANKQSVIHYLHKPLTTASFRELGYVRHAEAIRAEQVLGVPRNNLFFLGFPDGGTYSIATDKDVTRIHRSPFTGLTRAAYPFAYQRNAPYSHRTAVLLMESVLRRTRPRTVMLNLEIDIHSDHRAARILMLEAIRNLGINPTIYAYLIHYLHWPNRVGPLLPPRGVHFSGATSFPLTIQQERSVKIAYSMYQSQSPLTPNSNNVIRLNELFWKQSARSHS